MEERLGEVNVYSEIPQCGLSSFFLSQAHPEQVSFVQEALASIVASDDVETDSLSIDELKNLTQQMRQERAHLNVKRMDLEELFNHARTVAQGMPQVS